VDRARSAERDHEEAQGWTGPHMRATLLSAPPQPINPQRHRMKRGYPILVPLPFLELR
jgi:hypothetical protein